MVLIIPRFSIGLPKDFLLLKLIMEDHLVLGNCIERG